MLASTWKSKPKKDAKNVSSMLRPSYSQLSHVSILGKSGNPNISRTWDLRPWLGMISLCDLWGWNHRLKPSPSHPNVRGPCWKLPAFSAELHISVSSSKKIGLQREIMGKSGKISWEKGGKSWRKKRKFGIELGVITSYRDWSRYSVSFSYLYKNFPNIPEKKEWKSSRYYRGQNSKCPPFWPWFTLDFFCWSGAPALLTDTWWVTTNSIHGAMVRNNGAIHRPWLGMVQKRPINWFWGWFMIGFTTKYHENREKKRV